TAIATNTAVRAGPAPRNPFVKKATQSQIAGYRKRPVTRSHLRQWSSVGMRDPGYFFSASFVLWC
ncbi:MAG TPA: hypothetical protein PK542_13260, partial [Treponemataceae bacterium]|nr:hypothetical protein [Treponemataceae bacterium]